MGFDLWPREHDLPPRWDGMPVVWGGWDDTGHAFVCPPAKPDSCDRCASTRPRLLNVGRIWNDPETAPTATGPVRLNGRRPIGTIAAFRCPGCGHDRVLDHENQAWDLDPTDYGEDGSWDITAPCRPR